jgi:glycosyltransferase involved in cell wall biosynthesis
LHNPLYAQYFAQLPEKLKEYDALVYMSNSYQDKIFGDEHGVGQKAVCIPNGASREEFVVEDTYNFKKRYNITTPKMALCVANHYVAKGHRFVIEAFNAMQRADTTLVIIGNMVKNSGLKRTLGHFVLDFCRCKLSALFNRKIKLVSTNDRRAVISAYKQANVFLFGSSVECAPLVMYEAFAGKTPFVAFPAGNMADHKNIIKLVETPAEMARVANYILDDRATAEDIASRAYHAWEQHYTWDIIAKQYEQLYKKITA